MSPASLGVPWASYTYLTQCLEYIGCPRGLVERRNGRRETMVNKWYSSREKKLLPVYMKSPNISQIVTLSCLSWGSSLPRVKSKTQSSWGTWYACGEVWHFPVGCLASPQLGNFILASQEVLSPLSGLWEDKRWSKKPTLREVLESHSIFYG